MTTAVPTIQEGDIFAGRYRIEGLIGQGGFGVVYKAIQLDLDRPVALKLLHRGGVDERSRTERIVREAQIIRALEHPNTVHLYDSGTAEDGTFYIALQLLDGEPLNRVIERDGPFGVERTAHVALQVLRSLIEAHGHGIIHRDIKPSNIFLCRFGGTPDFVKLLDFGLAKAFEGTRAGKAITVQGQLVGTPLYMTPEQVRGESLGPSTDLYALGLVMSEMLTGSTVLNGENVMHIYAQQLSDRPLPLPESVLNGPLGRVIACATAKSAADRYPTAESMLEAIIAVIGMRISGGFANSFAGASQPDSTASAATSSGGQVSSDKVGHKTSAEAFLDTMEQPAPSPDSLARFMASQERADEVVSGASPAAEPAEPVDKARDAVPTARPVAQPEPRPKEPVKPMSPPEPEPSTRASGGGLRLVLAAVGGVLVVGLIALGVLWFGSEGQRPPWDPDWVWSATPVPDDPDASTVGVDEDDEPDAAEEDDADESQPATRRRRRVRRRRVAVSGEQVQRLSEGEATAFDPSAYLPRAHSAAQKVFPDARLVMFDARGVDMGGHVNLDVSGSSVVYRFRSRGRSSVVATEKEGECLVDVHVVGREVRAVRVGSRESCAEKLLPTPTCSLAGVWKKAQANGELKGGRSANIAWIMNGWFFQIGVDEIAWTLKDECP